jgi:type I restriction enzyme S subunit
MTDKKMMPQIRFKGFSGAWEQRKLGDIVVFLNGRAYKQAELLDSGKYPVLRVGNFNTNDKWYYSDLELPAKNYADKGDLLYTWATAFGPHIWKGPKVIYHYHIWKVETTSDISKNFAVHLLDADQAQMTNSLNGSTMVHITKGTMENKIVTIPGISEQRNMARLLDQLDCTIALHQRKLDLLKEQKKGYLQKMFPKNGEKVPELRFAGVADDWEERKLGNNIVSIQTGTNLLGTDANEGTPLLKMGNIQRGYFSFNKLEYLDSNSNVESENIVNYGDFLFNTRNTLELVGKGATWTGMSGKYAFNSNIARFKFNGIDTIFFNYLYNTQQVISQVHARAVGTTSVAAVYPRDLNSLLYYLPSIEEQKKIGSFFNQLDNTIALHQRKLDLLKEQKKGYLQKMFPK